jgi:hypothetical protein
LGRELLSFGFFRGRVARHLWKGEVLREDLGEGYDYVFRRGCLKGLLRSVAHQELAGHVCAGPRRTPGRHLHRVELDLRGRARGKTAGRFLRGQTGSGRQ